MVPVKGQAADLDAFRLARHLALENKAKIYVLYVIEVARELPVDAEIGEETARAEEILARIESLAQEEKYPVHAEAVQARRAGPAIVQEATERGAQLVVLGVPYKHQFSPIDPEDTTLYVLRYAPCPVLLWRESMPVSTAVPWSVAHARASNGQ